jgi:hypothetical protein
MDYSGSFLIYAHAFADRGGAFPAFRAASWPGSESRTGWGSSRRANRRSVFPPVRCQALEQATLQVGESTIGVAEARERHAHAVHEGEVEAAGAAVVVAAVAVIEDASGF